MPGSDVKRPERFMKILRTIRTTFLPATAGIVAMGAINALGAQTPVTDGKFPAFEVASVKPHKADDQRVMMVAQPGGRFTASTALRLLIRTAYRLQDDQISGGPSWLTSDLFDIVAKAEDSASPIQIASMIQALLADRFKLAVHHETKELPVYTLVLARSDGRLGSQLRKNDCVLADTAPAAPDPAHPRSCGSVSTGFGRLTIRAMPMAQFLQFLSPSLNRVVLDRTGLAGNFDLDLQWTPDLPQGRPPGEAPLVNGQIVDPNGTSIFTAVQEQLGLKLESTKAPVDVLVIDHVEQPTPD
jgi:uncharacterized protein (TIGR03435 family)